MILVVIYFVLYKLLFYFYSFMHIKHSKKVKSTDTLFNSNINLLVLLSYNLIHYEL